MDADCRESQIWHVFAVRGRTSARWCWIGLRLQRKLLPLNPSLFNDGLSESPITL
jgi:hypothetical protein